MLKNTNLSEKIRDALIIKHNNNLAQISIYQDRDFNFYVSHDGFYNRDDTGFRITLRMNTDKVAGLDDDGEIVEGDYDMEYLYYISDEIVESYEDEYLDFISK